MRARAPAPTFRAMKAACFDAHGGPDHIVIRELPDPEPGPGEVLVEVRAAALNHLDLWTLGGLPGLELEMPHIGGSEMAGVVAAAGEGVTGWAPGTRVVVNPGVWCDRPDCDACAGGLHPLCPRYGILGEHYRGGFAELAVVPARNLYPLPEGIAFASAAAVPLVFQTAWRALMTRAAVRPGETVLITGASGGVSTAAVQIAKRAGARVLAVTSGPENAARVAALGADIVIDRLEEDFSKRAWQETGKRGVDVVLDSVGEATFEACVRSLAPLGRMVVYGATTGPRASFDIRRMFWRQTAVLGSTMGTREEFERVMALFVTGELAAVVDVVWPLDRAREAYERLRDGDVFGKVVLTP